MLNLFYTFTHYVKVAFFRGTSLRPVAPGASTGKDTRYIDIHEGDELDAPDQAFVGPRIEPAEFSRRAVGHIVFYWRSSVGAARR